MNISKYIRIVIVGLPATGKSTLADQLMVEHPDFTLFRTDDYIQYGFRDSLFVLQGDVWMREKIIVEGVQAYRMLIAGVRDDNFYPDLVIHCSATTAEREKRYAERQLKINSQFDNQLRTWWREYSVMRNQNPPEVIEHSN